MNKHTFAVLAYKDSPYLSECLNSLKSQTIESTLYISTSTPSAYIRDLAKKYDVGLFVTEPGKGAIHDTNFALQQAKTKYITLAHQDDIYLPDYAETCLAAAEKYNNTQICFTNYSEIIDGKEKSASILLKVKRFMFSFFMPFKSNIKSKFWKMRLLSFGNPISAPTIMYNLEKLPGFQFPIDWTHKINISDWETWCNVAKKEGRFVYVRKVLLQRRIHADSLTSLGLKSNARYEQDLEMFKQFWPTFLAKILAKIYAIGYKGQKTG